MILKSVKVECVDNRTGLVLKKIITSEQEYLNRKLAVNNGMMNCEESRTRFNKSLLTSPFQIHHIRYEKSKDRWMFDGVEDSKRHAVKNKRLHLAFQQRTDDGWTKLTWSEAESDFQDLATRGLPFVPYVIPITGDIVDWKQRKSDGQSILNKSQTLVPVFCSMHNVPKFSQMFDKEFSESKLVGIQCYGLGDLDTVLNLTKVKITNMNVQEAQDCPLLLYLNHARKLKSSSNVSGTFAYSCFAGDIFSERQTFLENMPPNVVQSILQKSPDDIYRYDTGEGGFNFSEEQKFWSGIDMTNAFLQNVSLTEVLSPFQAIKWANHFNQQSDLDLLNQKIHESREEPNSVVDFIRTKSRWASFWSSKIEGV